ncbi:uncharacterized protein [Dermacentor albipictus]|uniref:uncharacterized protein isoform X2 n=1 Tax=Dermacentor albipictus TaxID=60249 RepID=UPI0038FCB353
MKDQDPDYLADDVGAPYEANPNMAPPFEAAPQGLTPPQPPPNQAPQPSPNQAADEDDPNTGGGKSDVPPITHKTPRRPTNQGTRGGSGASTRSIRTASPVSTPAAIPPSVAPLPPADEHAPSTGDGKSAVTPVIYTTTSRPVNPSTRRGSGTSARTIPTPSPVSTPAAIPPSVAPLPPADEHAPSTGDGKSAVTPVIYTTTSRPVNPSTRRGSGTSARTIRIASPVSTPAAIPPSVAPLPPADEDATSTGDGNSFANRGTRGGSGTSARTIPTASPVSTPAGIPPSVAPLPPADEHAPNTGDGNSGVTLVIYTTPSRPVSRSTRRGSGTSARTIRTASPVSTPVAILPTVTTLPPIVYRPPQAYSMICTVGCHGKYAVELPPDGLCDFIFLDSLYDGCTDQFVQQRSPSRSWRRFQALAASGIKTQFGISIDTLGIQKFLGHLRNRQTAEVWASQSLWNNNIYHWGIMNLHQVYLQSRPALLKEALEALKEAAQFSLPSPTKRVATYTFLGFYTPLPSGCDLMGQEAASVFMPDAIVVLGHTSFQENKIPSLRCVLLPPNIYKIPPGVRARITHAHTFHEACLLAQCLRTQQKLQVPIGVSFTMKGRWYQPKIDDYENPDIGEYDLFKDCVVSDVDQDALPAAICNLTNTNYTKNLGLDSDDITMRTYDKGPIEKHTQMFDNRATYLKKFCYAKNNLTQAQFSIAIYDVNFDSSPSICQPDKIVGNFSRTQLLYNINTVLKTGSDLSNLTACMKITR